MPIYWLSDEIGFPDPHLTGQEGIFAVGGDLSAKRLLLAYKIGAFPWFNPEDPILWWCPDPRFVVFPNEIKVSKSMRPYFNQQKFKVTFDQNFEAVINGCQKTFRPGQGGETWLTEVMKDAYTELHNLGLCHSVEVWQGDEIVAGLYGISLGKCFFGESMFSTVNNASKFGFITLVRLLEKKGFWLIDCQQGTDHLISMGARGIPREEFLEFMEKNSHEKTLRGDWNE
ncbi:MAG: leucyl/phenylalanyl-tRNA--protein transferase, partial [Saprospiraceae bacterium]